jgi:hypothetical protein
MAKIREGGANSLSLHEAVRNTVLFGLEHGIMVDFLRENGPEVLEYVKHGVQIGRAIA